MKIKTVSFKKPTKVTVKQKEVTRIKMNIKDLSGIATAKKIKLQNIVRKQITTLAGIRRKLFKIKAS